ncbi:hypothetical protein IJ380_03230 [Candidatus Saccharibacteria bacterium]|nr:hypothetical protein [Candidatus Saccharibacteria bacterium]
MQTGKTIAAKRNKPESDSERERVRKSLKKTRIVKFFGALVFLGVLLFLSVKAFQGWYEWISRKEEVIQIPKEPTIQVIDDRTGKEVKLGEQGVSTRMMEFIAELEEEFALVGRKVVRARIPADKTREVDLEIEGFSGVVKVSLDRNAAVSAEDGERMLKYLENSGISEVQYIDIRLPRKAYWK